MRGVMGCQTSGSPGSETRQLLILVNGERRSVAAGLNVRTLLDSLGIDSGRVAVELNRSIVRQADWVATPVLENAEVEIVQFVGGG